MSKKSFMLIVSVVLAALLSLFGCSAVKGTEFPSESKSAEADESAIAAEPNTEPAAKPTPEPTPKPTPEPTPEPIVYEPLSKGDERAEVSTLQARLMELGYMRKNEPTEYYGSVTERAVKLFERQCGLTEDGAADSEMLALLYSQDAQANEYKLAGVVIGIDPGHQSKGNSEQEPVSPGSSKTKKKVSSGTQGRFTGVPEFEVNLAVGLLLKDMLEAEGATVIMTRETNDVNISNVERAVMFNEAKTDYALRLHCNGSDDASVTGAFMLIPKENPFEEDCARAAELLLAAYCEETGMKSRGVTVRGDQTGFNWCERMIVNIEMGHMTNKEDDNNLTDAAFQQKMAEGLCNGILDYFY